MGTGGGLPPEPVLGPLPSPPLPPPTFLLGDLLAPITTLAPSCLAGSCTLATSGADSGESANGNQKKAGVAKLISEKRDFKTKTVTRDKEGHYIMFKGSIQE